MTAYDEAQEREAVALRDAHQVLKAVHVEMYPPINPVVLLNAVRTIYLHQREFGPYAHALMEDILSWMMASTFGHRVRQDVNELDTLRSQKEDPKQTLQDA